MVQTDMFYKKDEVRFKILFLEKVEIWSQSDEMRPDEVCIIIDKKMLLKVVFINTWS